MTSSRRSSLAVLAILALAAISPFLLLEVPSAAASTITLVGANYPLVGAGATVSSITVPGYAHPAGVLKGDIIVVGVRMICFAGGCAPPYNPVVTDNATGGSNHYLEYAAYTASYTALGSCPSCAFTSVFVANSSGTAGHLHITVTWPSTDLALASSYNVGAEILRGAGLSIQSSVGVVDGGMILAVSPSLTPSAAASWFGSVIIVYGGAGSASAGTGFSWQQGNSGGWENATSYADASNMALTSTVTVEGSMSGIVISSSGGGGGASCPVGYTLVGDACQIDGGPSSVKPGRIVLIPGIPEFYRYGLGGENAVVTNFTAQFRFVNSSASVVTIYLFIATNNGFFGLPSPTNPTPVVWGRSYSVANGSLNFKLSAVPNVSVTAGGQVYFGVATVFTGVALENSSFSDVFRDNVDGVPPVQLTSAVIVSGGPYMWITVSLSPQSPSTSTSTSGTSGCSVIFCAPAGLSCPGSGGGVTAYVAGFLFGSCVAAGWLLVLTLCVSFFALVAVVVTKTKSRGVPALVYLFPWLVGFFIGTAFGWLDPIVGILILLGLGSLGALGIRAKI